MPIADRIDNIYNSSQGLDKQLNGVHRLIQDLTITNCDVQAPPVPARNPARSPIVEATDPLSTYHVVVSPEVSPLQRQNTTVPLPQSHRRSQSPQELPPPGPTVSIAYPTSPTQSSSTSRAPSPTRIRVSELSFGRSSIRYSSSSNASSDAGFSSTGWPSPGPPRDTFHSQHYAVSSKPSSTLPRTPEVPEPRHQSDDRDMSLLPPPALGLPTPHEMKRVTSHASSARFSSIPSSQPEIMKLHRSSTTASQKGTFEKEAFRNSAVLCDV